MCGHYCGVCVQVAGSTDTVRATLRKEQPGPGQHCRKCGEAAAKPANQLLPTHQTTFEPPPCSATDEMCATEYGVLWGSRYYTAHVVLWLAQAIVTSSSQVHPHPRTHPPAKAMRRALIVCTAMPAPASVPRAILVPHACCAWAHAVQLNLAARSPASSSVLTVKRTGA
jgi:hypothetical protein